MIKVRTCMRDCDTMNHVALAVANFNSDNFFSFLPNEISIPVTITEKVIQNNFSSKMDKSSLHWRVK